MKTTKKKVFCHECAYAFYGMCHAPSLTKIQHGSNFPLGYRVIPANAKKQNKNNDCKHFERKRG